jgi:hypothetical protein
MKTWIVKNVPLATLGLIGVNLVVWHRLDQMC